MRRIVAFSSAGLLFAAASLFGTAGIARADDAPTTNQNQYSLTAEGDGMYYEVADDQLPATTDTAVSPYSAQASLDSNENSTAFAGLPYLGPVAETLGGTVNGLSGGNTPPIPPAPGFVQSTYPQNKTSTESQGPYLLLVNSNAYESDASAGTGVSPQAGSTNQQIFSKAKVIANADGSVESTASAGVDGLNLGPIDGLNVSSNIDIIETGTGDPKITKNINLGTFTVLGFTIGITQDGFNVLGDNLALPTATVLSTVNQALGQSGIQISVIPSTTSKDMYTGGTTVTSGGLQIVTSENVPTQGQTTFTYTYGRASVGAEDVALPSYDDGSDDSTDTTSTDNTATTTPTDTTSPAATVPSTTDTGTGVTTPVPGDTGVATTPTDTGTTTTTPTDTGSLPADTGTTPVTTAADTAAPVLADGAGTTGAVTPAAPVTTLGFLHKAVPALGTNSRGLYLVLVLAGLAALGGQQLFRMLGVRLFLNGPNR